MANDADVLELLRSRLADMEARQRSSGGTSASDFWQRLTSGMPSGPSAPTAESATAQPKAARVTDTEEAHGSAGAGYEAGVTGATDSASAAGEYRRSRRLAPETRPLSTGHGPWADEPIERLASLDPRALVPIDQVGYHEMVQDPTWIEATAARVGARAQDSSRADRQQAIAFDAVVGRSLEAHAEAELTAAAERVAHQRRNHEVTLVNIVSELVCRGIDAPGGLSRVDWLRSHDASLTAAQAKAFVTVGTALADAGWARLRMLVATQQITVGNAALIVDFHGRTAPVADPHDLSTALDDLIDQARQLRPEELTRLVRHHTEQIKPPRDEDALDHGRREARGLWFGQPNACGMVGLRGVLDPEGAAVLKAAIDPLSIPRPETDEQGRTVKPDGRTPARRRMDALLEIVRRGVASADGVPTTDKARVVVLIDFETLVDDVRGTGATLTGDVLSPGVVRRMACDAEIIPMVLGGDSEPLDVGRSRRLFTRAQRMALIARDKGCSWPGCTVPASWCDAHHVSHWRHGGRTSLLNGALLCPKHHTEVHELDLTATVTTIGVTWHT